MAVPIKRLQVRIMLAMLVGAMLFAVMAAVLGYRTAYQRTFDEGTEQVNGLLDAVDKTLAIGAYTGDKVLLQDVIDGMARNELVARVDVRDARGTLLVRQYGHRGPVEAVVNHAGQMTTRKLAAPFDKNESVGDVQVYADVDSLHHEARKVANNLAWMMGVQSTVLALLLYVMVYKVVTRPIQRLADQLRNLPPGTSAQLHVPRGHRDDEIGTLVESANVLLASNHSALRNERTLRAEIEKMEAQYRQIFDASSAGIFVLDHDGRLVNCNPTALRILGGDPSDVNRFKAADIIHDVFARPDHVLNLIDQSLRLGGTVSDDLELLGPGDASRWVHCLISVQHAEGWPQNRIAQDDFHVEGVMYDITDRKSAEAQARHLAEHDALTGARNRRASEDMLERLLIEASADSQPVSVLFLDLDGFKQINDQHGHHAGDQVLVQCAQRMRLSLRRSSDVVGRLGGDEFVILLKGVGSTDPLLIQLTHQLMESVCAPITLDGGVTVSVGVSVGMACSPEHGLTGRQLLLAADEAMYAVKHTGKNAFAMAIR